MRRQISNFLVRSLQRLACDFLKNEFACQFLEAAFFHTGNRRFQNGRRCWPPKSRPRQFGAVQHLKAEVQRISDTTAWNTTKLLDGSTPVFDFQVGLNATENDKIEFDSSTNVSTLDALGMTDLDYTQKESSRSALLTLDSAQTQINGMRANLGALQNRLVSTTDTLAVTEENLAAANSRIRDTDVAASSTDMARNNLMLQAGTATLAQANQNGQLALKLIG